MQRAQQCSRSSRSERLVGGEACGRCSVATYVAAGAATTKTDGRVQHGALQSSSKLLGGARRYILPARLCRHVFCAHECASSTAQLPHVCKRLAHLQLSSLMYTSSCSRSTGMSCSHSSDSSPDSAPGSSSRQPMAPAAHHTHLHRLHEKQAQRTTG
jgi:hypothetical protein